ncbi:MAG: hypothetical protein JWL81_2507, partial [Verrucomicrobiales bacterium]|nr:hypothetical protein [Verrucomicrobiales bacterium]
VDPIHADKMSALRKAALIKFQKPFPLRGITAPVAFQEDASVTVPVPEFRKPVVNKSFCFYTRIP